LNTNVGYSRLTLLEPEPARIHAKRKLLYKITEKLGLHCCCAAIAFPVHLSSLLGVTVGLFALLPCLYPLPILRHVGHGTAVASPATLPSHALAYMAQIVLRWPDLNRLRCCLYDP
jgi:hypothetical protein